MKYRYSLIPFISSSLYFLSPLFNNFLQYSSDNTFLFIYRVPQKALIFHPTLRVWWAFTTSIFGTQLS